MQILEALGTKISYARPFFIFREELYLIISVYISIYIYHSELATSIHRCV